MDAATANIVGLIPAAGRASRLGRLPFSKELMPLKPVGNRDSEHTEGISAAIDHALDALADSNVSRSFIVIAPGKWDIPAYLGDGSQKGLSLSYLITESSPSVPHSLDAAYPFVRDSDVALLFPDIVFRPRNALTEIIDSRSATGADAVLALVPSSKGDKVDFVHSDSGGVVREIIAKPGPGNSGWTWIAAAWNSRYTEFMHDRIDARRAPDGDPAARELYVADVFNAAIRDGLVIRAVQFAEGQAVDIGTPGDLRGLWRAGM